MLLLLVLLSTILSVMCEIREERTALMDLFEHTGGVDWKNVTKWGSNIDVCEWEKITCYEGSVTEINLENTGLLGNIPDSIGNFTNLKVLNLSNNKLTGSIPVSLGNLKRLLFLNLGNNHLRGAIPELIGYLNVSSLFLHGNLFSSLFVTSFTPNWGTCLLSENPFACNLPDWAILNCLAKCFFGVNPFVFENKTYNSFAGVVNSVEYYDYSANPVGYIRDISNFTFSVAADNDAALALSMCVDIWNCNSTSFEITIGGWGNSVNTLGLIHVGESLPVEATVLGSFLGGVGYRRSFWVSWFGDYIRVGTGYILGLNEILKVAYPFLPRLLYLHLSTGWGSTGVWRFPSPVDCIVSAWTEFSPCNASCFGGVSTRSRIVLKFPEFSGNECPVLLESRVCNTQDCVIPDSSSSISCEKSIILTGQSMLCLLTARAYSRPIITPFSSFTLSDSGSEGFFKLNSIISNQFNVSFTAGKVTGEFFNLWDGISLIKFFFVVYGVPDSTSTISCVELSASPYVIIGSILNCVINARRQRVPIFTKSSFYSLTVSHNAGSFLPINETSAFRFSFIFLVGFSEINSVTISDSVSSIVVSFDIISYGLITYDGGTNRYLPSQNLTWSIDAPVRISNYWIWITFNWMDIEYQVTRSANKLEILSSCTYDYVTIYNGSGLNLNQKISQFCAGGVKEAWTDQKYHLPVKNILVEIKQSVATVNFISDKSNQYRGFELKYKFVASNSLVTTPAPNPPRNINLTFDRDFGQVSFLDYPNNEKSRWQIKSNRNCSRIDVIFTLFEVEEDSLCSLDYVLLKDSDSEIGNDLAILCGMATTSFHSTISSQLFSKQTLFSSFTGLMNVMFFSDSENSYAGFHFNFSTWWPEIKVDTFSQNSPFQFRYGESFRIKIPYKLFIDPLSSPGMMPNLEYIVSLSNGDALPPFVFFNRTNLEISGFIWYNYTGILSFLVNVTNSCGYQASLILPVELTFRSVPDTSSLVTCISNSLTLNGIDSQKLLCKVRSNKLGKPCSTDLNLVVPSIVSGRGDGYIDSLTLVSNSEFSFVFWPVISGGVTEISVALLDLGHNVVVSPSLNISVFCLVDKTSSIECNTSISSAHQLIDCFITPKMKHQSCYSEKRLFPHVISAPDTPVFIFSSDIKSSSVYYFQMKLGSLPGVYSISPGLELGAFGSSLSFDVVVVEPVDTSSIVNCEVGKISKSTPLKCCIAPMSATVKKYALAADFSVNSTVGFASPISPTFGTRLCFLFTLNRDLPLQNDPYLVYSRQFDVYVGSSNTPIFYKFTIVPVPDSTSSIQCPRSAYQGETMVCQITARLNSQVVDVLANSFTPVVLSGVATPSVVAVRGSNGDLSSSFTVSFQLSLNTPDLIISDGVSEIHSKIFALGEPNDVRFLTCSESMFLAANSLKVCTFDALFGDSPTSTFSNRFSVSIVNNFGNMGRLSSVNSINSSASTQFHFSFESPSASQSLKLIFKIITGGKSAYTKVFSIVVYEQPDSSSVFKCNSKKIRAHSPVSCVIYPRISGKSIFSHYHYFEPNIIKGTGVFSAGTPEAGLALTFYFTPTKSNSLSSISVSLLLGANKFELESISS